MSVRCRCSEMHQAIGCGSAAHRLPRSLAIHQNYVDLEPTGCDMPLVSIVTICRNNPADLRVTLDTLQGVSRELFEIVVVDGSTDLQCNFVVEEFHDVVTTYLRERDTGKYDAMNKGVAAISGESVICINSGDRLRNAVEFSAAVSEYAVAIPDCIIYGDYIALVSGQEMRVSAPPLTKDNIRRGILPSHQATLIPAKFYRTYRYDTGMQIAADTKLMRQAFRELPRIYLPQPIAVFAFGGVSTSSGGWKLVIRQYLETIEACDLLTSEKLELLLLLICRKITHSILGANGLQAMQARRIKHRRSLHSCTLDP